MVCNLWREKNICMKKFIGILILTLLISGLQAQIHYNPQVAIKPIGSLSVHKVELAKDETRVTVRIVNQDQLPAFGLPAQLVIRKTSEPEAWPMLRAENVPVLPQKHTFSFKGDILEFTLIFPPIPQPVKYLDIKQPEGDEQFYLQGIILDEDMNREISRGFRAWRINDMTTTLEAFKNVAEMDPYFEFGLAHFNVIYILASQKQWAEASEWYRKFEERFFYDKTLLQGELARMGIISRLEAGK